MPLQIRFQIRQTRLMNPFLGGDAGLVEDAVLAVAPVSGAEKVGEVIGSAAAAAVGVEAVVLAVVVPLPEVGSVLGDAVVVEQTSPLGVTEQLVGSETRANYDIGFIFRAVSIPIPKESQF